MAQLLLVDRTLLRDDGGQLQHARLDGLIPFSHGRWRLLLLAWQPEQWRPTRRSVDADLMFQQQAHEQMMRLGADLDGFVYLPSPVFGRRRMRARSLSGVIRRYRLAADAVWLVSSRAQDIEVGIMAGVQVIQVGGKDKGVAAATQVADFEAALAALPRSGAP